MATLKPDGRGGLVSFATIAVGDPSNPVACVVDYVSGTLALNYGDGSARVVAHPYAEQVDELIAALQELRRHVTYWREPTRTPRRRLTQPRPLRCPDCGAEGEAAGHMGCQFPNDHG